MVFAYDLTVILRCTAKVLALLQLSTPAVGEATEHDWYAHLVRVDRRKCLLMTHAGTLFSVFVPNVTAAGLRPIGPPVVSAIQAALRTELCRRDPRRARRPAGDRRQDRRSPILGTINDLAFTSNTSSQRRWSGPLYIDGPDQISLHRTINSITGYVRPIELVTARRRGSQR